MFYLSAVILLIVLLLVVLILVSHIADVTVPLVGSLIRRYYFETKFKIDDDLFKYLYLKKTNQETFVFSRLSLGAQKIKLSILSHLALLFKSRADSFCLVYGNDPSQEADFSYHVRKKNFSSIITASVLFLLAIFNVSILFYNFSPEIRIAMATTDLANTVADIVIGQADKDSDSSNQGGAGNLNTLYSPQTIHPIGGKLFLADYDNSRALIFNSTPATDDASANVIVGQDSAVPAVDYETYGWAGPTTLQYGESVFVYGTKMFIADYANHRVLIFNSIPTSNNARADVVIGQVDFSGSDGNQGGAQLTTANTLFGPTGVFYDGSKLFITDNNNNRVLIYNSIPTSNNASADVVIGQPNMTADDANQGGAVGANTLKFPNHVYSDGTKLFISDSNNNRVLIYNTIPTADNASADLVIGQPDLTSDDPSCPFSFSAQTICNPNSISSDGTKLFITDAGANRVLIYNTIPVVNHASADVVIGQANMTSGDANRGGSVGANTLYYPRNAFYEGGKLFISDHYNHRVLIYNTIPVTDNASADVVVGQPNMTSDGVNQGGSPGANTLARPSFAFSDGTKLFVADNFNSRVLIYSTIPVANNTSADVVVGQKYFTVSDQNQGGGSILTDGSATSYVADTFYDGSKYFVVDKGFNRVLVYNSLPVAHGATADVVIGQPDMYSIDANQGTTTSANTLNQPTSVYSDGTKLFIVDSGNNRTLIYNTIPSSNNANADVVIGQANMTSGSANQGGSVSASTLNSPNSVYASSTKLYIADTSNNRVLIYNTIPTADNASADVVVGQANMTSSESDQDSIVGADGFDDPKGVFTDGVKLYVADYSNHRVLIFNTIPASNNASANVVIGQSDFISSEQNQGGSVGASTLSYPTYASIEGNYLYIADQGNHRVMMYEFGVADAISPTVSGTISPSANNQDVEISANITAVFSEHLATSTVTTSSFTLRDSNSGVAGSVSYANQTATFNPTQDLECSREYFVTLTTTITDLAGNPMSANYTWQFMTSCPGNSSNNNSNSEQSSTTNSAEVIVATSSPVIATSTTSTIATTTIVNTTASTTTDSTPNQIETNNNPIQLPDETNIPKIESPVSSQSETTTKKETKPEIDNSLNQVESAGLSASNESVLEITHKLLPGASDPEVSTLKQMLVDLEYLPIDINTSDSVFNQTIVEAVKNFQADNNIPTTGVVGDLTISALNRIWLELGRTIVEEQPALIPEGEEAGNSSSTINQVEVGADSQVASSTGQVSVILQAQSIDFVVFKETIQKIVEVVKDIAVTTTASATNVGLAVSVTALAVIQLASQVNSVSQIPSIFINLFSFLAYRKKRRAGIVYDAKTGQPVPFAQVTIYDNQTQTAKETKVTDKYGSYFFLVPAGDYTITATKSGYNLLSEKEAGQAKSSYASPYTRGKVLSFQEEDIVNDNIPIERITMSDLEKIFSRPATETILSLVFFVGLILSAIFLVANPTAINYLITSLYLFLSIVKYANLALPRWGLIRAVNGAPEAFSLVEVFNQETKTFYGRTVADQSGRYAFILDQGKYSLKAKSVAGQEANGEVGVKRRRIVGKNLMFKK